MEVIIRNKKFGFDIQTLDGKWNSQNVLGSFAFPISIGHTECFIKKISYSKSSYDFFNKLKGKEVSNIPCVYEIKKVEDDLVLFQSFNLGELLDKKLRNSEYRNKLDLNKVAENLFCAINELKKIGFWHTDICFLNIQVLTNGECIILDLDSFRSLETKVKQSHFISFNQNLAGIFKNYYLKYATLVFFDEKEVNGYQFNSLQIASLLCIIHYLKLYPTIKFNSALESNSDLFVEFIHSRHHKVREVFAKGINVALNLNDYLLLNKYLPFEDDLNHEPKKSEIAYFRASATKVNYNGTVTIEWSVNNDIVNEISGICKNLPNKGSFEIKNIIDQKTLVLNTKSGLQKTIIIDIDYSKVKLKFSRILINDENAENGYVSVDKGSKLTLAWDAENSDFVKILISDVNFNKNYNAVSYRKINGLTNKEHNKICKISYEVNSEHTITLHAINNLGGKRNELLSKPISIRLNAPKLLNPVINKFEIDGSNNNQFTFSEGTTCDLSWNVSNATKISINGSFFPPIGNTTRTISSDQVIDFEAINENETSVKKLKAKTKILLVRKNETSKPPPPFLKMPVIEILQIIDKNSGNIVLSKNGTNTKLNSLNNSYQINLKVHGGKEINLIFDNKFYQKIVPSDNFIRINLPNDTLIKEVKLMVAYTNNSGKTENINHTIFIKWTTPLIIPKIEMNGTIENRTKDNSIAKNLSSLQIKYNSENAKKIVLHYKDEIIDLPLPSGNYNLTLFNQQNKVEKQEVTLIAFSDTHEQKTGINFNVNKRASRKTILKHSILSLFLIIAGLYFEIPLVLLIALLPIIGIIKTTSQISKESKHQKLINKKS